MVQNGILGDIPQITEVKQTYVVLNHRCRLAGDTGRLFSSSRASLSLSFDTLRPPVASWRSIFTHVAGTLSSRRVAMISVDNTFGTQCRSKKVRPGSSFFPRVVCCFVLPVKRIDCKMTYFSSLAQRHIRVLCSLSEGSKYSSGIGHRGRKYGTSECYLRSSDGLEFPVHVPSHISVDFPVL